MRTAEVGVDIEIWVGVRMDSEVRIREEHPTALYLQNLPLLLLQRAIQAHLMPILFQWARESVTPLQGLVEEEGEELMMVMIRRKDPPTLHNLQDTIQILLNVQATMVRVGIALISRTRIQDGAVELEGILHLVSATTIPPLLSTLLETSSLLAMDQAEAKETLIMVVLYPQETE